MSNPALDEQLLRWQQAQLVTADQAAAIASFEAAHVPHDVPAAAGAHPRAEHVSGIEILVTLGVAITLFGILALVYSSTSSLAAQGSLTMAIGLLGVAAMIVLRREAESPVRQRGAASCAALGAVAIGVGLAQIAASAGIFVSTVYYYDWGTTDATGAILFGAMVVAFLAAALLFIVPGFLLGLVLPAALYTAALQVISMLTPLYGTPPHEASAAILIATAAVTLACAFLLPRKRTEVVNFMVFIGAIGASVPLFMLGGDQWTYLDVLGGIIAIALLTLGLKMNLRGLAYGGSVGVAGLVLDAGFRLFGDSPQSFGIFFVLSGVVGIALIVVIKTAIQKNLARPSVSPPQG